jgi:hypothetical protein
LRHSSRSGRGSLFTVVTAATVWSVNLLALGLKGVFDRERPYE